MTTAAGLDRGLLVGAHHVIAWAERLSVEEPGIQVEHHGRLGSTRAARLVHRWESWIWYRLDGGIGMFCQNEPPVSAATRRPGGRIEVVPKPTKISDGTILPLYRLRYIGSASIWGFAIYLAGRDGYEDNILPSGGPESPRLRLRPLPQRPHRLVPTPDESGNALILASG